MKYLWLLLICFSISANQVKIAIVGGKSLGDVVSANLANNEKVEVYERILMEEIISEHQISQGQLKSYFPHAEIIVKFSSFVNFNNRTSTYILEIINATNGTKLALYQLPNYDISNSAFVLDKIQEALQKRNIDKRKTISIGKVDIKGTHGISSKNSNEYRIVLEQALLAMDDVALLERFSLDTIIKERNISRSAIAILASNLFVDLKYIIGDRGIVALEISINDFSGKLLQKELIENIDNLPIEQLSARIKTLLNNIKTTQIVDIETESARYFKIGTRNALISAVALSPTNNYYYIALLNDYLKENGSLRLDHHHRLSGSIENLEKWNSYKVEPKHWKYPEYIKIQSTYEESICREKSQIQKIESQIRVLAFEILSIVKDERAKNTKAVSQWEIVNNALEKLKMIGEDISEIDATLLGDELRSSREYGKTNFFLTVTLRASIILSCKNGNAELLKFLQKEIDLRRDPILVITPIFHKPSVELREFYRTLPESIFNDIGALEGAHEDSLKMLYFLKALSSENMPLEEIHKHYVALNYVTISDLNPKYCKKYLTWNPKTSYDQFVKTWNNSISGNPGAYQYLLENYPEEDFSKANIEAFNKKIEEDIIFHFSKMRDYTTVEIAQKLLAHINSDLKIDLIEFNGAAFAIYGDTLYTLNCQTLMVQRIKLPNGEIENLGNISQHLLKGNRDFVFGVDAKGIIIADNQNVYEFNLMDLSLQNEFKMPFVVDALFRIDDRYYILKNTDIFSFEQNRKDWRTEFSLQHEGEEFAELRRLIKLNGINWIAPAVDSDEIIICYSSMVSKINFNKKTIQLLNSFNANRQLYLSPNCNVYKDWQCNIIRIRKEPK